MCRYSMVTAYELRPIMKYTIYVIRNDAGRIFSTSVYLIYTHTSNIHICRLWRRERLKRARSRVHAHTVNTPRCRLITRPARGTRWVSLSISTCKSGSYPPPGKTNMSIRTYIHTYITKRYVCGGLVGIWCFIIVRRRAAHFLYSKVLHFIHSITYSRYESK